MGIVVWGTAMVVGAPVGALNFGPSLTALNRAIQTTSTASLCSELQVQVAACHHAQTFTNLARMHAQLQECLKWA